MNLSDPVRKVPFVGPQKEKLLHKLNIRTVQDLLYHFPSRYEDYSKTIPINQIQVESEEKITVQGQVGQVTTQRTKNGKLFTLALIHDETGSVQALWWNQPWIANTLRPTTKITLSGKIGWWNRKPSLVNAQWEKSSQKIHTGRLVPIYPTTAGISPKWFRTRIQYLIQNVLAPELAEHKDQPSSDQLEFLPKRIRGTYHLISLSQAIKYIHFPTTPTEISYAKKRLGFDEILLLQLKSLLRRKKWRNKKTAFQFSPTKHQGDLENLIHSLPFRLTKAQEHSVQEILADLSLGHPMNRLLQGDVGSGKTIVATIGLYATHLSGFQSALMAPTEVLANQHFKTISTVLKPFQVDVRLYTSSRKNVGSAPWWMNAGTTKNGAPRAEPGVPNPTSRWGEHPVPEDQFIYPREAGWFSWYWDKGIRPQKMPSERDLEPNRRYHQEATSPHILVGTHALLYNSVQFEKLGLVVIDEQHRFGVLQRAGLVQKSPQGTPHVLTLTATPIPRSIALTIYGDQDLSLIDELPPGRRPVQTWVVPPEKRAAAYQWIDQKVQSAKRKAQNLQTFIIYPLIDPSESETKYPVKAATAEFSRLKTFTFPNLKLGLLHGRLPTREKEKTIEKFRQKQLDLLVSTSVIEVGIDIPSATIMVIENAERFGLASLHQLRGRVGRDKQQAYCLVFTQSKDPDVIGRLKHLEHHHKGIDLSELDLKMRGPGELFGVKQHGFSDLKIAQLTDLKLIEKTQKVAEELLSLLDKLPKLRQKVVGLL